MNGARGETKLWVDGAALRLCLTLGALAEIETAFACTHLGELDARLRAMSAADLKIVLAVLLRGGGAGAPDAAQMAERAAPAEAARAVAEAFRLGLAG